MTPAEIAAKMTPAHGVWIKQDPTQELLWIIDGDFITDRALRSFIFHNNEGYSKYVGPCILKCHTSQYAKSRAVLAAMDGETK